MYMHPLCLLSVAISTYCISLLTASYANQYLHGQQAQCPLAPLTAGVWPGWDMPCLPRMLMVHLYGLGQSSIRMLYILFMTCSSRCCFLLHAEVKANHINSVVLSSSQWICGMIQPAAVVCSSLGLDCLGFGQSGQRTYLLPSQLEASSPKVRPTSCSRSEGCTTIGGSASSASCRVLAREHSGVSKAFDSST